MAATTASSNSSQPGPWFYTRPWFRLIAVSWCLTARLKQLSLVDLFTEFMKLKGGQYG